MFDDPGQSQAICEGFVMVLRWEDDPVTQTDKFKSIVRLANKCHQGPQLVVSERDLSLEPLDYTDKSAMLPLTHWFLCPILTTLTIWKYLAYLGSLETVIARKSRQNVWNYQNDNADIWLFCLYTHCTIIFNMQRVQTKDNKHSYLVFLALVL